MPLAPWIIEKIRKREEDERRKRDQPQPQLPLPEPPRPPKPENPDDGNRRGVVIIEPGEELGEETRGPERGWS